jgi:hypothetical protein
MPDPQAQSMSPRRSWVAAVGHTLRVVVADSPFNAGAATDSDCGRSAFGGSSRAGAYLTTLPPTGRLFAQPAFFWSQQGWLVSSSVGVHNGRAAIGSSPPGWI